MLRWGMADCTDTLQEEMGCACRQPQMAHTMPGLQSSFDDSVEDRRTFSQRGQRGQLAGSAVHVAVYNAVTLKTLFSQAAIAHNKLDLHRPH